MEADRILAIYLHFIMPVLCSIYFGHIRNKYSTKKYLLSGIPFFTVGIGIAIFTKSIPFGIYTGMYSWGLIPAFLTIQIVFIKQWSRTWINIIRYIVAFIGAFLWLISAGWIS